MLEATTFEFLDADTRPTFVLDALRPSSSDGLEPIFQNRALLANDSLFTSVHGKRGGAGSAISWHYSYQDFFQWLVNDHADASLSTYAFQGHLWSRFIFKERWVILSATIFSNFAGRIVPGIAANGDPYADGRRPTAKPLRRQNSADPEKLSGLHLASKTRSYEHDWTRMDVDDLCGHTRYARSVDWASTPLGPIEDWTQEFRTIVNMCFAESEPVLLYWGPDRVVLYNAAYIDLIAENHPCMGKQALEAFPAYADFMATIFDRTGQTGETFAVDDLPIFLKTAEGHMQEAYISLKMIPILNATDQVVGVYQRGTYSTASIFHKRRLETLKNLTVHSVNARTFADYWQLVFAALGNNDKDIMFAMAYTNSELCAPLSMARQWDEDTDLCCQIQLRGHLGIDKSHPAAVETFTSKSEAAGFMPWFRKAGLTEKPVILRADDGSLPGTFLDGVVSTEYNDPCRAVVISPLRYSESTPIVGFLVIGSNPRTNVDSTYVQFQQALATTIGTYMGSLARFGEAVAQHDAFMAEATAEQAKLFEQLAESRQQVFQTEKTLRHFVETSQVGVFVLDRTARYVYRNQWWSKLTNASMAETVHEAWDEIADPEYLEYLWGEWDLLLSEKRPRSYEFKTLTVWEPNEDVCRSPEHEKEHRIWLMVSAVPDLDANGNVAQVLGSVTDISALKWASKVHERNAEDAIESKRRLESFMDTTNHELRNPLSAVLLASDDIMTSVTEAIESGTTSDISQDAIQQLLQSLMENARTIEACAKHQKRIVDDVLTASKLDAMLLTISPSVVNLRQEILDCIQIFKADAALAKVQVSFHTSYRFDSLESQTFMLDITRFIQIFMNLLTNAMKFTKFESKRTVEVEVDVSTVHPNAEHGGIQFFSPISSVQDPTTGAEWGAGRQVYITLQVKDSGKGLTPAEADNLFNRFSQASPKTHVRYGGSGLGLFISRRLAELQGGGIGFKSSAGIGSTFSYFVRCRLAARPPALARNAAISQAAVPTTRSQQTSSSSDDLSSVVLPSRQSDQATPSTSSGSIPQAVSPAPNLWTPEMLHILVVEDNLINQRMLAKQLTKLGCHVYLANHGAEALEQIQDSIWGSSPTREITVVLMDWEMPVLDGLASTRIIREREQNGTLSGRVPVLGVTANVRKEQMQHALDAGMDDILCKPFHIPELLDKIYATLARLKMTPRHDITMGD